MPSYIQMTPQPPSEAIDAMHSSNDQLPPSYESVQNITFDVATINNLENSEREDEKGMPGGLYSPNPRPPAAGFR
ncbi:hypothetical protein HK097_005627 [Rhizophlyctis rosea]|uniref:Uncharacterized protein n=1 Tax=Rhizophlyctis rosea TaxID=64517 RepID=A0AAD5SFD6_9FUNG|nr:hypothetical protein HK097_005627 [Rhizophlyctis rosea]